MTNFFEKYKNIVIKIGSSTITEGGNINEKWFEYFIKDLASLKNQGKNIVIVTSGAIAVGRKYFGKNESSLLSMKEKQAISSLGQIDLIYAYKNQLQKHNINVAQLLLCLDDTENRTRFVNTKNTLFTLLKNNVIPVINENDAVATQEIKYGDNDRLSARVAQMIGADVLILLSDIDGLYEKDPRTHKDAKLIKTVNLIDKKIKDMAGGKGSSIASGGMKTKIDAAIIATEGGCDTIIALGQRKNPLSYLNEKDAVFSKFIAKKTNLKKAWIKNGLKIDAKIIVDKGAEGAIKKGFSLLAKGAISFSGKFSAKQVVKIENEAGVEIARGICEYSSDDLQQILGKNSAQIKQILNVKKAKELVHIDKMGLV